MSTTYSLRPITDYVDPVDIPLFDLIKSDAVDAALDQILVANAWTDLDQEGFTLGAEFDLGDLPRLQLPGLDQISIEIGKGGTAVGVLRCSEQSSLELKELELSLVFSPDILIDVATGEGASINSACGLRFDAEGFHFLSFRKARLPPSRIAGTDMVISLTDIELGGGGDEFLKVGSARVELPWFTDSKKSALVLDGDKLSFGRDGPSGTFELKKGASLDFSVCGFSCELAEASLTLKGGQLISASLHGRIDLSSAVPNENGDGWVAASFSIGASGLSASLTSEDDVFSVHVRNMFTLGVTTLRLDSTQGQEALWFSGTLQPEIDGLDGDWPDFEFDEIGITSTGQIRLAQGAQIATTAPFTLNWNFATLTVTGFSLERPKGAPDELKLRISAKIEIVKGLPAGASVDGLVAHWHQNSVDVSFNGIGVTFGSPGGFSASIAASWDTTEHAFRGSGRLQIPSIDLEFAVIFDARWMPDGYTAMFLAAETSLPGGIPIAATGLSLYAVSGILAHNYELKIDPEDATDPRRFYNAFTTPPEGFASLAKWRPAADRNALGLGVVIGTGDDGWAFSARGSLIISFPDLSVLVTASANLLTKREPMIGGKEGKLTAVLALLPPEKMLRLDFGFEWVEDDILQIKGGGGGEAFFNRPLALRFWTGLPPDQGAPITASLFRFDSDWLLKCQFWMIIDISRSVTAGIRASLDLRPGSNNIYAELVGSVAGDFGFTWEPYQFEGKLAIDGRATLVAGGVSLSQSVTTSVEAYIPKPAYFRLALKSCIEINLGFKTIPLCLHFTFGWGQIDPPDLPAPKLGLSLVPRDWVPRPSSAPDKVVDDGIATWFPSENPAVEPIKIVQPHSIIALEFSKSMTPALRNAKLVDLGPAATPLPQPIGGHTPQTGGSGFAERWLLTDLVLTDETLGTDAAIFGNFQRSPVERQGPQKPISPRPDNSQLWLLSSNRFGSNGSLSGGGAQDTPPVDCKSRTEVLTRKWVSLASLNTGVGTLESGWIYRWSRNGGAPPNRQDGVLLGTEDIFQVWVPPSCVDVFLEYAPVPPRGGALPTKSVQNPFPREVRLPDRDTLFTRIGYDVLTVADGTSDREGWHGSAGTEEWNLSDAALKLLHPGHKYTFALETEGRVIQGGTEHAGRAWPRKFEFQVARAPDWDGALEKAVCATYPADGNRPIYRGYDLAVRFTDDYVRALYVLDGRRLGIRLLDANGAPVEFAPGKTISPDVAWTSADVVLPPVEQWWRRNRAADPCEAGAPPPPDRPTVLPVVLAGLHLEPLARYTAELVAVEDEATERTSAVLARWAFTTSAFERFTDLAAPPPVVPTLGLVQESVPASEQFEDLATAFKAPAVCSVAAVRMTPVRNGTEVAWLLIEAPEPLDDVLGRLAVSINAKTAKSLIPNLDHTRVFCKLGDPVPLADRNATLAVDLVWKAAAPDGAQEHDRTIAGAAPVAETVTWHVPLRGLI